MDGFNAVLEELQAAYQATQRAAEELADEREMLSRATKELTSAHWTGAASRSYAHGWATWERGAAEVQKALAELSGKLQDCLVEYQERDSYHSDAFAVLGGALTDSASVPSSVLSSGPKAGPASSGGSLNL